MRPTCPVWDEFGFYRRVKLTIVGPYPLFFVSVASKGFGVSVSGLETTLRGISVSVDSKGA